jgi:hypothetical protein
VGAPIPTAASLSRREGHVQQPGHPLPGRLGRHLGMPRQLLHGGAARPRLQRVTEDTAPQVVRAEQVHACPCRRGPPRWPLAWSGSLLSIGLELEHQHASSEGAITTPILSRPAPAPMMLDG